MYRTYHFTPEAGLSAPDEGTGAPRSPPYGRERLEVTTLTYGSLGVIDSSCVEMEECFLFFYELSVEFSLLVELDD